MSTFTGHEDTWALRLGSVRNIVRQHLIGVQLGEHLAGVHSALDVGCGQGTQALRLARRGIRVTGVDPSASLLTVLREDAEAMGVSVRTLTGTIGDLPAPIAGERFDLGCAHGLLMYLDDPLDALVRLSRCVTPGGLVSFTVRNGDALAYRPGVRGDYAGALRAFDTASYVNDLGASARAHRRAEVEEWCRALGFEEVAWYGVRVLTDGIDASVTEDDVDIDACLAAEVEAGRRDPYRSLGSMLHFVARVPG